MRPILPSAAEDSGFRFTMPAPVGGWNARDNIAQMRPTDALILDNWFPSTTDVGVRPGSAQCALLSAGQNIQSLMALARPDGTFVRFAASQAGIVDITAGGGPINTISSAATTGKWESVQLNVAEVPYLWCCAGDGMNKSRVYNGSTDTWTILDGSSTPVLTGPTSEDVTNVSLFKGRIILCVANSLSFWYGPVTSVGGVFTNFDLGQIFRRGGYLVATTSWTVDAGDGADDHFVAITSEGEIAVYKGTDPSNASTFTLVGVFHVGKPIGKRCFVKLAGDVGILTEEGLWPISRALLSSSIDKRAALSDKIQQAFNAYSKSYGSVFGWQAVLLPKGPAVIVNVPLSATESYQFVMNTQTGSWCRFTGWNATCMMVVDGALFFAIGNVVKEGWTGLADQDSAITCSASTAFSYGPSKLRGKHIKLVKPILQATAPIAVSMALDTDFNQRTALQTQASLGGGGIGWDTAIWDTSTWADGAVSVNRWKKVRHKPGGAFSLRMRIQVKAITASWASTDFIGEIGGLTT